MATYLTPEEKGVADAFTPKRVNYVEKGLKPGLTLLADRKYEELGTLLSGPARELYDLARADLEKLVAIQVKEAKIEYDTAERQYAILIGDCGRHACPGASGWAACWAGKLSGPSSARCNGSTT